MWFQRAHHSLVGEKAPLIEHKSHVPPISTSDSTSVSIPTIKSKKESFPWQIRVRCCVWGSLVILLVVMCCLSFEPWSNSSLDTSTASPIGKIECTASSNDTGPPSCPFQNWTSSDPLSCRLAWFLYSFGLLLVGGSVAWRLYARTPQQLLSRRRWQTAVHLILLGVSSTFSSLILWATHCNTNWLANSYNQNQSHLSPIWYFLTGIQCCLLLGTIVAEAELYCEIRQHRKAKAKQETQENKTKIDVLIERIGN